LWTTDVFVKYTINKYHTQNPYWIYMRFLSNCFVFKKLVCDIKYSSPSFIHSFCSLSYDWSVASSKASSP
jgi:hypothetical protein